MSETVSALAGAQYSGIVDLSEPGLTGMITLRGDLGSAKLAEAVRAATGASLPGVRRIETGASGQVAWMSPDELLLVVDYARAPEVIAAFDVAMQDEFVTVADVSDARALLTVTGPHARDVLAKICPVDFAGFEIGEIRRTRAAQIAAAVWRQSETEWRLVCFRSVAGYMWDLLQTVSQPGGEVRYYNR
jgi:sarcosine oxidase, subunit gamma